MNFRLSTIPLSLINMLRRAEAEANEIESMKRKVDLEGRRLLVVRAAEKAGFWYTVNFEGLGGGETPPPPALILTAFSLFVFRLWFYTAIAIIETSI